MARYGYGMSVSGSRTRVVASSGGAANPSIAFNSSGGQVASITGNIPADWVRNDATVTSVTFSNDISLTSIGSYAFYQCQNLTNITFTPTSSVTSIGDYAFSGCGITSFTIPNSVLTINSNAFYSCPFLTSITIPSSVTTIGSEAFESCPALATVSCYVAQSAFTGSNAFYFTASPLVIQARITDASWTAGVGLTFQGNTNVTVIKNL